MISVIVPVLNESQTIASVVEFARLSPGVSEVIVVDDGSIDGTPQLAEAAGAIVVTSTLLGKGASLEDGVWTARNDVVLFLDGDLSCLAEDLVERMTSPVLRGEADFVKARFTRSAGRVTLLTARPLLRTFFPEIAYLEQPLGGIVAARRSLLRRLRFENDYGVDVGLLLDASAMGAAIAEVDIGHIEHDSQPLEALGDMAVQVVRTVLDRAGRQGRLGSAQVRELQEDECNAKAALPVVLDKIGQAQRLALFDMDGTLLKGRFIQRLAQRTKKTAELEPLLDHPSMSPEERTHAIARIFSGVEKYVFEETARNMPLNPGAVETIVGLRKLGYRVGIVTDSFFAAAEIVRRRVFADFALAHLQKFRRGLATGDITLSPAMIHPDGCPRHALCKANVLEHLIDKTGVDRHAVLAVGDGENDICLLKSAVVSVAYQPKTLAVSRAADHVVVGSLSEILELVENSLMRSA